MYPIEHFDQKPHASCLLQVSAGSTPGFFSKPVVPTNLPQAFFCDNHYTAAWMQSSGLGLLPVPCTHFQVSDGAFPFSCLTNHSLTNLVELCMVPTEPHNNACTYQKPLQAGRQLRHMPDRRNRAFSSSMGLATFIPGETRRTAQAGWVVCALICL